ncbi:MAG: hypothetical protein ACLGIP_15715, partial [Alphaproteobacteria bacterium]
KLSGSNRSGEKIAQKNRRDLPNAKSDSSGLNRVLNLTLRECLFLQASVTDMPHRRKSAFRPLRWKAMTEKHGFFLLQRVKYSFFLRSENGKIF